MVPMMSPLTFDPSIVEIFVTLSSGACLLMFPEHVRQSPRTLLDVITQRNKVSVMQVKFDATCYLRSCSIVFSAPEPKA